MSHRMVAARTIGIPVLLLACSLAGALLPAQASAQARPSNNMWTRSVSLYLNRARQNPRAEDRRDLYSQALEAVKEGMAQDGGNPRVWFLAGQVYVLLDSIPQADSAFTRAQELYPDYEEEIDQERHRAWIQRYNAGIGAVEQQNLDLALSLMQKADIIYDKVPMARLQLGSLYARSGETEQAIEAYRGALEVLRGPAREAVADDQAAQWRENEEVAAFNLAQLLAGAGRDEEAAEAYREFLAREPDNRTAKVNLAVVLSRLERTDEASEIYAELLGQEDMSDAEYFNIGIGLYNADQFMQAAAAFQKSLEVNPHSRDALYNLAQALYRQSTSLEEAREKASGDEQAKAASDLDALYEELQTVAERLRAIDPNNRNGLLLLARAYTGRGDAVAGDAAVSDEWRNRALAVLEAQEALPVEVSGIRMAAGENSARLTGSVRNLSLEAGTPVRLRLTLLGTDGAAVGSAEVTVEVGEAELPVAFEAEIQADAAVAGWKYEVVS